MLHLLPRFDLGTCGTILPPALFAVCAVVHSPRLDLTTVSRLDGLPAVGARRAYAKQTTQLRQISSACHVP